MCVAVRGTLTTALSVTECTLRALRCVTETPSVCAFLLVLSPQHQTPRGKRKVKSFRLCIHPSSGDGCEKREKNIFFNKHPLSIFRSSDDPPEPRSTRNSPPSPTTSPSSTHSVSYSQCIILPVYTPSDTQCTSMYSHSYSRFILPVTPPLSHAATSRSRSLSRSGGFGGGGPGSPGIFLRPVRLLGGGLLRGSLRLDLLPEASLRRLRRAVRGAGEVIARRSPGFRACVVSKWRVHSGVSRN